MTLSDWANIGQVIAAVAVVVSLIFVGLQVRQNTKSSQAATLQLNADYWLNYITAIADPKFSSVYAMVLPDEASLTNTNLASFSCYAVRPLWDVKTSIINIDWGFSIEKPMTDIKLLLKNRSPHFLVFVRCGRW
jgi:hypothetical protein